MAKLVHHFKKIFASRAVKVVFFLFVAAIVFSVVMLTRATTPNPGHPWTDIGNGNFSVNNTQTATRNYIFPDTNASILTSSSSLTFLQRTVTANATLSASTDTVVYVDASSSAITVTLPLATSTADIGVVFIIKKVDVSSNLVTVAVQGSDKIDTLTSVSFANRGEGAVFQSDGAQWRIVLRRDYDINGFHTRGATASTNQWYSSPGNGLALSTAPLTANKIAAVPLLLSKISTIDQMGIKVTAASGTAELGIYNDNGNLYPGTLAIDCGSFNTASAVAVTSTCNVSLDAGLYWMVIVPSNTLTVQGFGVNGITPMLGYASTFPTNAQFGWTATLTKGALPGTFPSAGSSTITTAAIPTIYVRFSQ